MNKLLVAILPGLFAASFASAQPAPGSIEVGVGGGRFFGGSFQKGSNDLFDPFWKEPPKNRPPPTPTSIEPGTG